MDGPEERGEESRVRDSRTLEERFRLCCPPRFVKTWTPIEVSYRNSELNRSNKISISACVFR